VAFGNGLGRSKSGDKVSHGLVAPASAPRVGCMKQGVAVAVFNPDHISFGIGTQAWGFGDDVNARPWPNL